MPGPVSRLLFCLALALGAFAAHAKPLTLDIYNPGSDAIFPVTSVLIAGEKELILVDAQFEKNTPRLWLKKFATPEKNSPPFISATTSRIFILVPIICSKHSPKPN